MNQMNPNQPASTAYEDEIDLYELWQTIWSQKLIIILITTLITISAGIWAFNLPKVYEAETFLLPPKNQHITQLNIQNIGGISSEATTRSVFDQFRSDLLSYENQKAFFNEQNLAEHFEHKATPSKSALELFMQNFKFSPPAKNANTAAASFKYQYGQPELSAQWLNDYVAFTLEKTKLELVDEIDSKIIRQKTNLSQEASALISQAEINRQRKIIELTEALAIAKKAGINEPAISQQTLLNYPQYLKGSHLLAAEIGALKSRDSDVAFIPELSKINQHLAMLESLKINTDLIQVAQVDQIAKVPASPVKPNKKLIVAVALVLGGMLGIFIALIRGAVRKRQQNLNAV